MKNVNIYAFADEADASIDLQIKALKRNNLNGLEIRNVDGTNISDITLEKAHEVRKKLDVSGLITWSIGSPIGKINILNDDFIKHLDKFKHTLEVADILGAKNIRLFSFFMPEGEDTSKYKSEVIDRLGKFINAAKGTGINLCHENEKGIYGDSWERCLEIYEALPEIKGIFDPANFVQCKVDTLKAWEKLKGYIYYMHIKDALEVGKVVPAGKGVGNLSYIVKDFIKMGKNNFTIEPHLKVFAGFSYLEKAKNSSESINEFIYETNDEAFDAACTAFIKLLEE